MIDEWIPYFECHKCGRYDYCKFRASPHPANPNRSLDIKCGVTVSIMKNYINSCFPSLLKYNNTQKQDFLDASFYFCNFINSTESWLGAYLNKGIVGFFGNTPSFFGIITQLRNQLDQIAMHLKSIPEFKVIKGILLVEGESEKEFVKTLKESHLLWFNEVLVESYEGKSNRWPSKLRLLAKDLNRKGYEIYLQADKDSKETPVFHQLIKSKIVKPENTIAFSHNFESSIPDYLLLEGLKRIGYLKEVSIDEFRSAIDERNDSITKYLETKWHLDIDQIKVPLAREVARLFYENTLWTSEKFWDSELGKFINLIRMMP